jgi:hypothetical protein
MLVSSSQQFAKAHFTNEAEIEGIVQQFAPLLFGSANVYLPQTKLLTVGGRGTIPDAIVIDLEREEWFVVEAERAVHGTWEHIAPQVSRQLAAVASPSSRDAIIKFALEAIGQSATLKQVLVELGVSEIQIHSRLLRIIRKDPTVAIPIDEIPKDLREWAQTLRHVVKIWVIEKYVSVNEPTSVLYSIPDETLPTITTGPGVAPEVNSSASQLWRDLIDGRPELVGQTVYMEYGPLGTQRQHFEGIVRKDGIELDGEIYSPSRAAVICIHKAGSQRPTANGWLRWKMSDGKTLTDMYESMRPEDAAPGP